MDKSKSYDAARKEMAKINKELHNELNDDFRELLSHLKYEKRDVKDPESQNAALLAKLEKKFQGGKKEEKKEKEMSYDDFYNQVKFATKQAPVKPEDLLTEKEKALARKQKLLKMQAEAAEQEREDGDEKAGVKAKREAKLESKRDVAIAKMVKEHENENKGEKKAQAAQNDLAAKIAK